MIECKRKVTPEEKERSKRDRGTGNRSDIRTEYPEKGQDIYDHRGHKIGHIGPDPAEWDRGR